MSSKSFSTPGCKVEGMTSNEGGAESAEEAEGNSSWQGTAGEIMKEGVRRRSPVGERTDKPVAGSGETDGF